MRRREGAILRAAAAGLPFAPLQASLSRNDAAFALRGMHFQALAADDVVVDLRRGPNYRRWIAAPLCADNGEALMNA